MDLISDILGQDVARMNASERLYLLSQFFRWFERARTPEEKQIHWESLYTLRLKYLLQILNRHPEYLQQFKALMREGMKDLAPPMQLAYAALPIRANFSEDFWSRVQNRFLPRAPLEKDLSSFLEQVFRNEDEALLIDAIDEDVLQKVVEFIFSDSEDGPSLRAQLLQAIYFLCVDLLEGAIELSYQGRSQKLDLQTCPEHLLMAVVLRSIHEGVPFERDRVLHLLIESENSIQSQLEGLNQVGVRIESIYLAESQRQRISRIRLLLQLGYSEKVMSLRFRLFWAQMIWDIHQEKSISNFLGTHLKLLAERIVRANSSMGEHYVAQTWADFIKMFKKAMGGGALTAITVFLKQGIGFLPVGGFFKGLLEGINYSGSFLAIQLMGFTLATKQPSATAPFIAGVLRSSVKKAGLNLIALFRTQFVAVLGNLMSVFPICFFVSSIFWFLEQSLFSQEQVETIFKSNQTLGPSLFYAAFTGVLLFLSSLVAGWFENFSLVTNLPKRLEYNSLLRSGLGASRLRKFSSFLETHSNALAANVSLGLMLGIVPQVLKFFALPLEVRHVTLATGSFATALPQIVASNAFSVWDFVNTISGLILIGVVNILVSFSLAVALACVSLRTRVPTLLALLKWAALRILSKPWLLIVPPRSKK